MREAIDRRSDLFSCGVILYQLLTPMLLNELQRRDERYGIACMCEGFGMAIAGIIERV